MNWLGVKWRRSILFRVITTTFLLSIILISLVGGILFVQITNGIFREKTNESVSEAQSPFISLRLNCQQLLPKFCRQVI